MCGRDAVTSKHQDSPTQVCKIPAPTQLQCLQKQREALAVHASEPNQAKLTVAPSLKASQDRKQCTTDKTSSSTSALSLLQLQLHFEYAAGITIQHMPLLA
jgi:hypothetical protein